MGQMLLLNKTLGSLMTQFPPVVGPWALRVFVEDPVPVRVAKCDSYLPCSIRDVKTEIPLRTKDPIPVRISKCDIGIPIRTFAKSPPHVIVDSIREVVRVKEE